MVYPIWLRKRQEDAWEKRRKALTESLRMKEINGSYCTESQPIGHH